MITPAQNDVQKKIDLINSDLNNAILKRDSGLCGNKINQEINKLKKQLDESTKMLNQKKNNAKYQQSYRLKRKALVNDCIAQNPSLKRKLRVHDTSGRPPLEDDQPELLKVLTEIATIGGGADDRRRTEMIRSCKTLDDLCQKLKEEGYSISQSALYTRLLPRDSTTAEGKRHVRTVPVKLTRATTDLHKKSY